MSVNTVEQNKQRQQFRDGQPIWLFGYGSLIFKADFPFLERKPAHINGWERRFWQGSHDHRGTIDAPGRVVTLIAIENAICHGMAYQITSRSLDHLDFREKNGYLRFTTPLIFADQEKVEGLVYIATEDNPAFLGQASEKDIAQHISGSVGPSGKNVDYLLDLASALHQMGVVDEHVFKIESYLLETRNNENF